MGDDVNGKEAGEKFLAENKGKEGVITLASGLQYKVLTEGHGLEHPKVGTPCECHYAGRLLDGSEFDSSYTRGEPTTFAPNQVIKGWTEAMQLMVVGDKWEMYIPYQLAYGESGRPPKIPASACLVFIMEICKIKGETVPKEVVFPEWTEEDLKLWEEKDEAACQKWREAREATWAPEDSKLREQHPSKEEFDQWLDKQCKFSKDKSLWKRTRKAKEQQQAHPEGKRPSGSAPGPVIMNNNNNTRKAKAGVTGA
jgi:FKBP-type peptidyl-prolyl cis-trans isomerase FklB